MMRPAASQGDAAKPHVARAERGGIGPKELLRKQAVRRVPYAQSQGAPPYCQCSRSRETYTLTPMTSTLAVEYLQRSSTAGEQLRLPGAQRYGPHGSHSRMADSNANKWEWSSCMLGNCRSRRLRRS